MDGLASVCGAWQKGNSRFADEYIYQHCRSGDPYDGMLLAIQLNDQPTNMEVFWMRAGLHGVAWPYELRRYIVTAASNTVSIYHTEGASEAPKIDVSNIGYDVVVHPNLWIRSEIVTTNEQGVFVSTDAEFWLGQDGLLHAKDRRGRLSSIMRTRASLPVSRWSMFALIVRIIPMGSILVRASNPPRPMRRWPDPSSLGVRRRIARIICISISMRMAVRMTALSLPLRRVPIR